MSLTLTPARPAAARREVAGPRRPEPTAPAPIEVLDRVDEWGLQSFPASDPPPTW